MRALLAVSLSISLSLSLSIFGCANVVGLEDFHKRAVSESAATASEYFALELQLVGMKPHLGHTIEYRVIDANNYVQSRGVIAPMTTEEVEIVVPRAIPRTNGPYRLDFFADVNESGGFDGLGSVISNDHAWRIEPLGGEPQRLRADDVVTAPFGHSTTFTNIDHNPSGKPHKAQDTGLGARVRVAGLSAFVQRTAEVRVLEKRTRHVVALYRAMRITEPVLDAVVSGCVDVSTEYDIDLWVDANGNGQYDKPSDGLDRGWRITATSSDQGLDASIDLASASADSGNVDVGAP
jgi:hypothetical protein